MKTRWDCVCDEHLMTLPGPLWVKAAEVKAAVRVRKARGGLAKVQRENHPVLSLKEIDI